MIKEYWFRSAVCGVKDGRAHENTRAIVKRSSSFWCKQLTSRLVTMAFAIAFLVYSYLQQVNWYEIQSGAIVDSRSKKRIQSQVEKSYCHQKYPRLVLPFNSTNSIASKERQRFIRLDSYYYEQSQHQYYSQHIKPGEVDESMCVFCEKWQQISHPTCNLIHEVGDLIPSTRGSMSPHYEKKGAKLLGQGGWRGAWELLDEEHHSVVLKTVRFESRFFDADVFHRHATDAIVTEKMHEVEVKEMIKDRHVTASLPLDVASRSSMPIQTHVVNIYGYCGHAVLNEFASMTLEKFIKRHRTKRKDPKSGKKIISYTLTPIQRLQYATQVATALANLHNVDGIGKNKTIVHKDLKPDNLVVVPETTVVKNVEATFDGLNSRGNGIVSSSSISTINNNSTFQESYIVKFSDFNSAKLLLWNTTSNSLCHFHHIWRPSKYRSPEEMWERDLTEKIDVYALGGILYFILTAKDPFSDYSKMKASVETAFGRLPNVTHALLQDMPHGPNVKEKGLPKARANSLLTHPATKVMVKAIQKAYTFDPEERPSSLEIRNLLANALRTLRNSN